MHLPNDILALQQAPGLSENDAASIDHLPGLKSLKMRVRHWGTAPNQTGHQPIGGGGVQLSLVQLSLTLK